MAEYKFVYPEYPKINKKATEKMLKEFELFLRDEKITVKKPSEMRQDIINQASKDIKKLLKKKIKICLDFALKNWKDVNWSKYTYNIEKRFWAKYKEVMK